MNNKKNKLSYLSTLRTAIQLLFLVLLPGLYANAFLGIKLIYQSIINQNFSFSTTFPQLISAIAIIPLTLLLGRFFCGWMCAFGTLGDLLYLLSRKVFKFSYRVNEKTDRYLKYVKYIILAYIVIVAWTLQAFDFTFFSPWDAFGNLLTFTSLPNFSYVITNITIGFILLLVIMVGSLFIERFFCRYLCPLGAVFAIISHLKFIKIRKPNKDCGACKACTKKCTMGIPLYQMNSVSSGECINCMKCVPICPRKNVNVSVANAATNPALAGAIAVTAITGLYYIGTFATDSSTTNTSNQATTAEAKSTGMYKDGTYEGSGTGFRGATTTMSVTITGGVITDIQAVSYGDDREFFDRAYNTLVSEIVASQSAEVDAVSGATFSSNGIMEAVTNALESAKQGLDSSSSTIVTPTEAAVSADLTDSVTKEPTQAADNTSSDQTAASSQSTSSKASSTSSKDSTSSSKDSTSSSKDSTSSSKDSTSSSKTSTSSSKTTSSKYKDGVYKGSANGFRRGITTVSVTLKNDVITDIEVVSNGDTPEFFDSASSTIIGEILDVQSTNVDSVSGATYSSMGIMNAVEDALSNAENS